MSYASVTAHNAPPSSQQPRPDPNLLTTERDVSGGSLPDVSRSVNVAPSDFKSNPHTVTSETTPAHYESSDDEQGNRTGSSKKRAAKDRARKSLHDAEEEGLYLWEQFKERVLRPGTAGGILGVVNVGLLAFAGREFYTKPHLRSNARAIGITAATALGLLGAEGALTEAYVKTEAGKKEKERAKKEGAALYRQTREVVLRPGVLGGLVGVLNLGILGGVGYAAYLNWDQPRWDRRTVSAISVGLLTLAAGEGYLGEQYVEKELPKQSIRLAEASAFIQNSPANNYDLPEVPGEYNIEGQKYPKDEWSNVPNAILSKVPRRLHLQDGHPISTLRALIESHFTGFSHLNSLSPVVTTKKNFDDLGFGPDHPGRNKTDTYYINEKTVLRTHTSAHEVEVFNAGERKWLLTADVYRRDEIDRSHYPVFHQMEGSRVWRRTEEDMAALAAENARRLKELKAADIIIEDDTVVGSQNPYQPEHNEEHAALVAANLKHSLNSMILKLFGGQTRGEPLKVRWIEAEFPWTTPSYEVEVWFQGKWLEILGCGVVKEPTLLRGGVNDSIAWAFGLGLERIAMVLYSIPDIRLFWSTDPRFEKQFTQGKISTFQPFSKYPVCWKDLSFWKNDRFHENDLCDIIRDAAPDLAEDVTLIDKFEHPKTGKTSLCYRINYRSMERSLTNEEINALHQSVEQRVTSELGLKIR